MWTKCRKLWVIAHVQSEHKKALNKNILDAHLFCAVVTIMSLLLTLDFCCSSASIANFEQVNPDSCITVVTIIRLFLTSDVLYFSWVLL